MKDKRLQAILELINNANVVADIATDHGNLAIELVNLNKSNYVLAIDIVPSIVSNLNTKLQKLNLLNNIAAITNDGLKGIKGISFDYVVIAGVGGNTIIKILSNFIVENISNLNFKYPVFILQPMTNQKELRMYLSRLGFSWIKEIITIDKNKYYTILVVKFSKRFFKKTSKNAPVSFFELPFCPVKNKEYVNYLKYQEQKINKVLYNLDNMTREKSDFDKKRYFKDLMQEITIRSKETNF